MSKKNRKYREHWYSGITEAILMLVPGSKLYRTMPARRARTGYRFILPFIIGFIVFMMIPMVNSLRMSLSHVDILTGGMTPANETSFSLRLSA